MSYQNAKSEADTQAGALPSEAELEAMLAGLQPRPGSRFYDRMETMPWRNQERNDMMGANRRLRAAAVGLAALLVLLAGLGAAPRMRVLAQEIIRFFAHAHDGASGVVTDSATLLEDDPDVLIIQSAGNAADVFAQVAVSGIIEISLSDFEVESSEEASERAGFNVRVPSSVPDGYLLDGIYILGLSPAVVYRDGLGNYVCISQHTRQYIDQMVGDMPGQFVGLTEIGVDTPIQTAAIGNVTGAYFRGEWSTPIPQEDPTAHVEHTWNPDAPVHRLGWEEGGITYEILAYGEGLTMADLIAIAESME